MVTSLRLGIRFENFEDNNFVASSLYSLRLFEKTRRERLKSALYLRLKKRKRHFFEKKLEIFEFFFFQKMSHSAEKCKKGDPLGFINIYFVAKYQKT